LFLCLGLQGRELCFSDAALSLLHLEQGSGECSASKNLGQGSSECSASNHLGQGSGECSASNHLGQGSGECSASNHLGQGSGGCSASNYLEQGSGECCELSITWNRAALNAVSLESPGTGCYESVSEGQNQKCE
jgi:hypothetical protein